MTRSLYAAVADVERSGEPAALCTVVRARGSVPRHAGSKMLVYADGRFEGTIGGGEMESRVIAAALEVMRGGEPQLLTYALSSPAAGDPGVCGGEVEIYLEAIRPQPTILVIGGGHVGRAIVWLAHWLGQRVALSDDRPEFCTPEWAPGADEYWPVPIAELAAQFKFNPQTYIVMPTRGVPVDVAGLPHLLQAPRAYLGVIGSRRRWATALKQLEAAGVSPEALRGVTSPMGLEFNAETPEEIALSIMAEIIMLQRGGDGQPMKHLADKLGAG